MDAAVSRLGSPMSHTVVDLVVPRLRLAAVAAAALLLGALPAAAQGPTGLWYDHTGRGAVEISQCGSGLCGHIVWLKNLNDKNGRPLVDILNGDSKKRNKPICGLQVIGGLKAQSDGSWDKGWIYDPEKGESFDVELRMLTSGGLQVKGYKGVKFLNETFKWTRADALPTARCK